MRAVIALAAAATAADVTMESGTRLPKGWHSVGQTPRGQSIDLTFAVRQRNTRTLQDKLLRVSTPTSPEYGRHLTNKEVHDIVAPYPEHIAAVEAFAKSFGAVATRATPNGDMLSVSLPVEVAERMLSAEYVQLSHNASGNTVHRAMGGYSLPKEVADAVDFVSPTVHVPGVRRAAMPNTAPLGDDDNTPKSLRSLYNIHTKGKAANNKQAVTAFLKQYYSESDLKQYWSKYCTPHKLTCGKGLPKLVGDATTGMAGVESMLDIETITGVAGNIESEFWGFSGTSPDNKENEPFMKWLEQAAKTSDTDIPKLFSTSYGEDESSWSKAAADRLNTEFQKLGARGVTLLYASGDEGANCESDKFVPETPSSSPWITAVGGTKPATGFPKPGSESAISLSSGGFSDYWAMPDYQKDAVEAYLKESGLPKASRGYNTSGRAYPDVSAQATNFCVEPFGCGVAGTSCASPTFAGVIGLLNDARLQNNKTSLGFLNPLIYQNMAAFNDITTGSSEGCDEDGWPAKKGWDAVTGLGTPDYEKLEKAVLALP